VAELAATIGIELHRWELLTDFYVYTGYFTGYGNRLMLGLTATGLAQCGGSCPLTSNILALQAPPTDQTVVLGGALLSASTFASRLTSGFSNQQACVANGQCPYEAHVLDLQLATPGTCADLDTYLVSSPGGGNLNNPANLDNALFWTANNGPNPLIAFQNTATSVTIDPTGGLVAPGAVVPTGVCQKFSMTSLNGTPCTCAANNVYSNGQLLNTALATPMMYFCTQIADVCQIFSPTNINGTPCTCAAQHINAGGILRNTAPGAPMMYFCVFDDCQLASNDNLNGAPCLCDAKGISHGHLQNSNSSTPSIYYCTAS
jgi:hypothetical protein